MKNTIHSLLALSTIVLLTMTCCADKKQKDIDFCQMLKRDQSHINRDTSDMDQVHADRQIRTSLIKDNFKDLIEYSIINGLPEMGSLKASGLDSCRNWAVSITIFHIGQIEPILLFDKDAAQLFKREIENGSLNPLNLQYALRDGFEAHEMCEDRKDDIHKALNDWKLNVENLPPIRFVDC